MTKVLTALLLLLATTQRIIAYAPSPFAFGTRRSTAHFGVKSFFKRILGGGNSGPSEENGQNEPPEVLEPMLEITNTAPPEPFTTQPEQKSFIVTKQIEEG
jgi:hypothetical protein